MPRFSRVRLNSIALPLAAALMLLTAGMASAHQADPVTPASPGTVKPPPGGGCNYWHSGVHLSTHNPGFAKAQSQTVCGSAWYWIDAEEFLYREDSVGMQLLDEGTGQRYNSSKSYVATALYECVGNAERTYHDVALYSAQLTSSSSITYWPSKSYTRVLQCG